MTLAELRARLVRSIPARKHIELLRKLHELGMAGSVPAIALWFDRCLGPVRAMIDVNVASQHVELAVNLSDVERETLEAILIKTNNLQIECQPEPGQRDNV